MYGKSIIKQMAQAYWQRRPPFVAISTLPSHIPLDQSLRKSSLQQYQHSFISHQFSVSWRQMWDIHFCYLLYLVLASSSEKAISQSLPHRSLCIDTWKIKSKDILALLTLGKKTLGFISSMFYPFVTNLISMLQLLSWESPLFSIWVSLSVVHRYYQKENKGPHITESYLLNLLGSAFAVSPSWAGQRRREAGKCWVMWPSRWQQAISSAVTSHSGTQALERGHTGDGDEQQSPGDPSPGLRSLSWSTFQKRALKGQENLHDNWEKEPKNILSGKDEECKSIPCKIVGTSWSMFLSLGSEMNGWRGWKNG